jgi:hypothetical protein
MGGTDSPENLTKLTIEEHAEAHRKLYEEHGLWEDLIAYLGLSKLLESGEAAQIAIKMGQIKGGQIVGKLPKDPIKQAEKIRKMWIIPGMREHLIEKRKEQSRNGNNPMQGKKQKRVTCECCCQSVAVNVLSRHQKKCKR